MFFVLGFCIGVTGMSLVMFFAIRDFTKFHKKTIEELVKKKKKLEDWIEAQNWKPDLSEQRGKKGEKDVIQKTDL